MLFFFNDTSTTEIYTLSLHRSSDLRAGHADGRGEDVQLRLGLRPDVPGRPGGGGPGRLPAEVEHLPDRKSTRLNSSHLGISYAVFCLKKKKKNNQKCIERS